MESALDVLTKAAHFVENQQQNGFEQRRALALQQQQQSTGKQPHAVKENGNLNSGHNGGDYERQSRSLDSARLKERHANLKASKDDQGAAVSSNSHTKSSSQAPLNQHHNQQQHHYQQQQQQQHLHPRPNPERMRLNDRAASDETLLSIPASHQHASNNNNGLSHHHPHPRLPQQRLYSDDRQLLASAYGAGGARNRTPDSPPLSPGKRPQSPHAVMDGDQQQRTMVLPHPLTSLASVAGHPLTHINPANPMLPFIHPMMYPAFDPGLAETLARQQGHLLSSEAEKQQPTPQQQQHSPGSPANAVSSSAGFLPAGLQGYMYPLAAAANPGYLMGARPAATGAQQPGFGLADLSMFLPQQLAAYGAANVLQGQLPATLGGLSEHEKRLYESLQPGFAPTPAHLLANPYFKSFMPPGLDAAAVAKDAAAAAAAAAASQHLPAAAASGIQAMPGYSVEFLLKYQEALNSEAMKMKGMSSPQSSSSPAPRRSTSPDAPKKVGPIPGYPLAYLPSYLANPALSKSPVPERKASTPNLAAAHKNGTGGPSPHQEPVRPSGYPNSHDIMNGDEARRRLMALAQRPRNPLDLYTSPYKGPHDRTDRRSPSPYTDRRRVSRERSPLRGLPQDKPAKKRSHEGSFGDIKSRSPSLQHQSDGNRSTKSPPTHRRSSSPLSRPGQRHSQAANPYLAPPGSKPNLGHAEKEAQVALMAQTHPYLFPQGIGSLASPYALQSYLRQSEASSAAAAAKASVAGFVPPTYSTAPAAAMYRAPAPTDAAALAEYSRLTGIHPYAIALMMPQQQQQQQQQQAAFRQSVIAHATPTTAQQVIADRNEREHTSPVGANPALAIRPHLPLHAAPGSNGAKMPASARDSPVPPAPGKAAKLPYALQFAPYAGGSYVGARTPPTYQDHLETRTIKREASPVPPAPHRRSSNLPLYKSSTSSSTSAPRSSEEERALRLKRKSADEDLERMAAAKEAAAASSGGKRKREVNSDANAPDIEEHFRRSLGGKYKKEPEHPPTSSMSSSANNKVSITGSVDDHFQMALGGDLWSRLKSSKSPDTNNNMNNITSNSGEMSHRTDPAPPPPPVSGAYPNMFSHLGDGRIAMHPALPAKPLLTGGKMVKARGIVYPEPAAEPAPPPPAAASRTYSSTSSSGRSDRSSPPGKLEMHAYPVAYQQEAKSRVLYQAPGATAINYSVHSPLQRDTKVPPDQEAPRGLPPSPLGAKHAPPPYAIPGPYPASPGPHSPQSSSGSASRPSPPRQMSRDGRVSSEGGATVPVTVQS